MPFTYTNTQGQTYYLHGTTVTILNGRQQQLYYFVPEPEAGVLEALPEGYRIEEHRQTGLPFLKLVSPAPHESSGPPDRFPNTGSR